jgi:hypothetical protein
LKIYAAEVGLHANAPLALDLIVTDDQQNPWYYSPFRHSLLLDCLQITKAYLEYFVSLPAVEILNLCTTDLLRLLYAILILGRFSVNLDAPLLDAEIMHTAANLDYHLAALSGQLRQTLASIGHPPQHHLWYLLQMCQQSCKWYNAASAGQTSIHEDLFSENLQRLDAIPVEAASPCVDIPGLQGDCPDLESIWDAPADQQ